MGCNEITALGSKIQKILVPSSAEFFDLKTDSSTLKCAIRCSNYIKFDVNNRTAPLSGFKFNSRHRLVQHTSPTT